MHHPQFCALARTAEILGERWTLLVVRELLLGPSRFSDLRAGLDGVSTSVLAQRLRALERRQLVRRADLAPPAASAVYELTDHGEALRPAIHALIQWGGRFLLPSRPGDRFEPRWLPLALAASARKRDAPPHAVQFIVPTKAAPVAVHVTGGRRGTVVSARLAEAELTLRGEGRAVLELATGMSKAAAIVASGRLRLEGDRSLASLVPLFFDTDAQGRPSRPEKEERK